MTATATRLLDNYIGGAWVAPEAATGELDVINPALGPRSRVYPYRAGPTSTRRSRRRAPRCRSGGPCR